MKDGPRLTRDPIFGRDSTFHKLHETIAVPVVVRLSLSKGDPVWVFRILIKPVVGGVVRLRLVEDKGAELTR